MTPPDDNDRPRLTPTEVLAMMPAYKRQVRDLRALAERSTGLERAMALDLARNMSTLMISKVCAALDDIERAESEGQA